MENTKLIADEAIMNQIYIIRDQKIMIDKDLAVLYRVETRVLKQAIKRNLNRFPKDFMFELTAEETKSLVIGDELSALKVFGGAAPLAFTEHGGAMLSSILNSKIAINVNIQIIRIFVRMRNLLTDQLAIRLEIAEIKEHLENQSKQQNNHEKNIEVIFRYLDELQDKLVVPRPINTKIGYKPDWK